MKTFIIFVFFKIIINLLTIPVNSIKLIIKKYINKIVDIDVEYWINIIACSYIILYTLYILYLFTTSKLTFSNHMDSLNSDFGIFWPVKYLIDKIKNTDLSIKGNRRGILVSEEDRDYLESLISIENSSEEYLRNEISFRELQMKVNIATAKRVLNKNLRFNTTR
jgi:hypothetical protein